MRIISGRVVAGKVVVEGEALAEGAMVTILAPEEDEDFILDSVAEAELLDAIAEADAGHTIPANVVLGALRDQE